jgi:hypothetical protein
MTRTVLFAAASLLLVVSQPALAQRTQSGGGMTGPGASEFAPGQRARETGRPASQFAPGQRARETGRPAREFAPGQRARVRETMRTRTSTTNPNRNR